MTRIHGELVINRDVERVFDLVADARNEPRYNQLVRGTRQLSAGPVGPGTRFRGETIMLGRPVATLIELTAYERPRRLRTAVHMAMMDTNGTLTFDPVPGGTRMRWSWQMKPRGVLKLLCPLVTRMGQRLEATNWANFKRFVEASPPAPPRAS